MLEGKKIMYFFFFYQVHEHQWWMGNSREAAFQRFCEFYNFVFFYLSILSTSKIKFYIQLVLLCEVSTN